MTREITTPTLTYPKTLALLSMHIFEVDIATHKAWVRPGHSHVSTSTPLTRRTRQYPYENGGKPKTFHSRLISNCSLFVLVNLPRNSYAFLFLHKLASHDLLPFQLRTLRAFFITLGCFILSSVSILFQVHPRNQTNVIQAAGHTLFLTAILPFLFISWFFDFTGITLDSARLFCLLAPGIGSWL